jgi:hypothetical protein
VEERSGGKVEKHRRDGGNLRTTGIEPAQADGVELLIPPKMAKSALRRGREPEPKPGGSEAVLAWKQPATSFATRGALERRTAHPMERRERGKRAPLPL